MLLRQGMSRHYAAALVARSLATHGRHEDPPRQMIVHWNLRMYRIETRATIHARLQIPCSRHREVPKKGRAM